MSQTLTPGGNTALNSNNIVIRVCSGTNIDVAAYRLASNGKVRGDGDMIFYGQTQCDDGSVSYRSHERESTLAVNLAAQPAAIERIAIAFSAALPLAQLGSLTLSVEADEQTQLQCLVNGSGRSETALILGECYRRSGVWKFRFVAQGFNGGLKPLSEHYGVEIADDAAAAPAAPAPAATAATTPAPAAAAPATPALSLAKERQQLLLSKAENSLPRMANLIKQAGISLEKRGLAEARYRVCLVLDISASMDQEYLKGSVQKLAERALALAARLDDDGEVEVYLFGEKAHRKPPLSLDNVRHYIDELRIRLEGNTKYLLPMKMVCEDADAAGHHYPTLVLFITDGATANEAAVKRFMIEVSAEPIFWKFMGIRRGKRGFFSGDNFGFLEELDDMGGRTVDNADFFTVDASVTLSDAKLFDLLVNELDSWQRAAKRAGILSGTA